MKVTLTIIITTIIVLFSIQNFDHVSLFVFSGKPIQIRLVFVIAISGLIGYLIRYVIGIQREEELKKKYRMLRVREKQQAQRQIVDEEEEEI